MWGILAQHVSIDPPAHVVGWGTLSLINAGLAQSKNHSGLLWWFLSLLLGPIATLIIVAVLEKREPEWLKPSPPREI